MTDFRYISGMLVLPIPLDGAGAVVDGDFGVDVGKVFLDRMDSKRQVLGNFFVWHSLRQQS